VKRLASILHPAEVTADAEQSLSIDAEQRADVDPEPFRIELRRELAFRLRDEQVTDY
jgi:hypothetical protein